MLQVMLGGEWFESMFGHPDAVSKDTIKQTALSELKSQLGITKEPIHAVSMIHKVSFLNAMNDDEAWVLIVDLFCRIASLCTR